MQKAIRPKRSTFRDNYLAVILGAAALLLSAASVNAQIYTKPNNSYGTISNRVSIDSTLFFPTGCGLPTDTTWLFSQGFSGAGQKLRKFAIYGDSCGNKAYLWIPSLQAWQLIGQGNGGVDTLYSRADSAFYQKDSIEHFAFLLGTGGGTDSAIAGRNGVKVAIVGTTRYLDADSGYVATRARLQKSLDSINLILVHRYDSAGTAGFATFDRLYKVRDSLAIVLNAAIALKRAISDTVGNTATSTNGRVNKVADSLRAVLNTLLGAKQDTSARFNFYAKKDGGRGINIARFADSSGYFKGLIDSLDHHSVLNADSTITEYVQAHDTTSVNALQPKYRSDTSRANIYAAIAASGGGLTAIADNKQLSNISGASNVPTAHELPIVMVKDYTVSDSTTDDLLGVRAAARRCADLGGCILQFPAGKGTRVTDTILFKSTVHITGIGGVVGTKYTTPIGGKIVSGSIIWGGGANKSVFVVDSTSTGGRPVFTIDNVAILSTQTPGTPTAGSAIVIRGFVQRTMIRNCTISGFWVDIDIHSGFYWTIADNWIGEPVQSCVRINDSVRTDTGDWGIYNNQFIAGNFNGSAYGIEWRSGGGLKVYGNKFDSQLFTVTTMFKHSIYLVSSVDPTSDVQISGNSIEDYQVSGIFDSCVNRVAHHIFTDNHTSGFVSTGPAIDVYNAWYVQITGNQWTAWAGISAPAMRFNNCIGVMAENNTVVAYTSAYSSTNSSINRMDYIRTGGEGGQAAESQFMISMRSAAGGPSFKLLNDTTGSFPQTSVDFYNDGGIASNKGASLVHTSSTATSPYANAFYMWNYDNGPVWFSSNNTNRGGITSAGNWLFGTTTDPGFGAKAWVNGKLGVQTMDSVAIGAANGGFVVRDAITGLYKLVANPGAGAGSPGGPSTSLQINASGSFLGYSSLTFDNTNTRLYLGSGSATFPQILSMNNSVNGGVGWTVENGNTGTSARQENIRAESSTKAAADVRFNSTVTSNQTGTSIPQAESFTLYTTSGGALGSKPIILNGTPVFAIPGSTSTNIGFRQDASGFRIDQIGSLHTSNTTPLQVVGIPYRALDSTNIKLTAIDANGKFVKTDWPLYGSGGTATPPAGSAGYLQFNNGGTPNVFGGTSNFRVNDGSIQLSIGGTATFPTSLNITQSVAGLIGFGIENANTGGRMENYLVESSTKLMGMGRQNSAVSGNWTNTNLAKSNNFYLYTQNGASTGVDPVYFNGTPIVMQIASSGTNQAFRMDATGLRIGAASGIGTANTVSLEAPGAVLFSGITRRIFDSTLHKIRMRDASGNEYYADLAPILAYASAVSTPTLQQVFNVGGGGLARQTKADTISGQNSYAFRLDSITDLTIKAQTITLDGHLLLTTPTAQTASFSIGANGTTTPYPIFTLGNISSFGLITLPTNRIGNYITLMNRNTSTGSWNFDGAFLLDAAGGTVSSIPTGYTYVIFADATSNTWKLVSQSYAGIPGSRAQYTIFTPTTGGTVTLVNNQTNIINPAGTLLALTVTLPPSPKSGDVVKIKFTQAVTTVTYSGGTVVDPITGPAAGGMIELTSDGTQWY